MRLHPTVFLGGRGVGVGLSQEAQTARLALLTSLFHFFLTSFLSL